jgi:leucyl-tRNA synthetase
MILGVSALAYKRKDAPVFVSFDQIAPTQLDDFIPIHASVQFVRDDILDVPAFRAWMPAYADARFELNPAGQFKTRPLVEKMSKSFHNVVNPDDLCAQHGADCFRLFEMFLGPLEQSKPFMTSGINGVSSFLRKLYNLYYSDTQGWQVSDDEPTERELKTLHQTLRKITEDIERLSFNTSIPQFMTCVNTLTELGCHKRGILEPLVQALAPFAPHLGEELWEALGHTRSVFLSGFPVFNPAYLVESSIEYPLQINGKLRAQLVVPAEASPAEVEALALAHETTQKWAEGRAPKKVIVVPGKIINIVF